MHPEDFTHREPITQTGPYAEKLQTGVTYLLVAWATVLVTGALTHYVFTHSAEIASFLREHLSVSGAQVIFSAGAVLLALGMLWLRIYWRTLYGAIEIGFSLLSIWQAAGQMREDGRYWIGIVAATYVLVRGLDNWKQGRTAIKLL